MSQAGGWEVVPVLSIPWRFWQGPAMMTGTERGAAFGCMQWGGRADAAQSRGMFDACLAAGMMLGWVLHLVWSHADAESAKRLWLRGDAARRREDARLLTLARSAAEAMLVFHEKKCTESLKAAVQAARHAVDEIEFTEAMRQK